MYSLVLGNILTLSIVSVRCRGCLGVVSPRSFINFIDVCFTLKSISDGCFNTDTNHHTSILIRHAHLIEKFFRALPHF